MGQNIYQFIDVRRIEPRKKNLATRKKQFVEIYHPFSAKEASAQADRCLDCGNPYCSWKCPVHNFIPQWLHLVNEGRIIDAVELSHETNSLPEICGRVCPQDRLCESACTLNQDFGAVTIGNIEKFITDKAFSMGWKPDVSHVEWTDKNVAIIGAGPAGLACADVLVRHGVKATVFDRHPEIGGLLTFGIPSFKLEKNLLRHRANLFSEMGVEFVLNTEIGKTQDMQSIYDEFDAVFLAVGTYQPMAANLPNDNAQGVYAALPYLIANNYQNMLHTEQLNAESLNDLPAYIDLADKNVIVLGGGDTAMDCVRTALRQQAASATCVYRRDEKNMPGSRREVKNAREEGAAFLFNLQPVAIEVDADNQVCGVKVVKTQLGAPDKNGRQKPELIEGSEHILPADAVVIAFGFQPHAMPWLTPFDVNIDPWGRINTQGNELEYQTSNLKIFAGGDAVRGSDLVVTAIYEGRQAAQSILHYLAL